MKWEGDGRIILRAIRYAIERKRSEVKLNYLAHYDPLTGIPNRSICATSSNAPRRERPRPTQSGTAVTRPRSVQDRQRLSGPRVRRRTTARRRAALQEQRSRGRPPRETRRRRVRVVLEDIDSTHRARNGRRRDHRAAFMSRSISVAGKLSVTASLGITVYPVDSADPVALLQQRRHRDVSGQGARAQQLQVLHAQHARADPLVSPARDGSQERRSPSSSSSFVYQPQFGLSGPSHPRRRGAVALESSGARPRESRTIHLGRRGKRLHHPGRALGHRASVPSAQAMAGAWAFRVPRVAINVAAVHSTRRISTRRYATSSIVIGINPDLIELELTERSLMEDTDEHARVPARA